MKISVDHVTNSSSESFGTIIQDTAAVIGLSIPFIAATMGTRGEEITDAEPNPSDDWGYEPYESTDPSDPPGTMIQNNPDGTVTKTLPDGTVGTQMPDGKIYVTQSDGTTGHIDPDGHQQMILPDGTKIEHYTDGTAYAEYPDGTTRTEYEDGTIREQDPSGEIVQINPDGSFEVTEPNQSMAKVYSEDGELIGGKGPLGTQLSIDNDGNITGQYMNEEGKIYDVQGNIYGDTKLVDDQGNFAEINDAGNIKNLSVKEGDNIYEVKEDGSMFIDHEDVETGEILKVDFAPDKGLKYRDSEGNFIDLDAEGKGRAHLKSETCEIDIYEDGRANYKDDSVTVSLDANGRVEARDTEGNYEIVTPNEDGSLSYETGDRNGMKVRAIKDSEGNYEFNAVDGSQLIITEDHVTVKDKSGEVTTYTQEDIDAMKASVTTSKEG